MKSNAAKTVLIVGMWTLVPETGSDRFGIDLRDIKYLKVGECYLVHYTSSLLGIGGRWAKFERKDNAC